jgi:hypothetical protein
VSAFTSDPDAAILEHLGITQWDAPPATAPPAPAIERAVEAARMSPCAKSKRGVAMVRRGAVDDYILNAHFNSPPPPMACAGTEACKKDCSKICMHAEQRSMLVRPQLYPHALPADLDLVHVKVGSSELVAGGPPSCWQCSRMILDQGYAGIWLYEAKATKLNYLCGFSMTPVNSINYTVTTTGTCSKAAVHTEHFHDKIRGWCEEHTPWSGHHESHEDVPGGGSTCDKLRGVTPTWVYYTAREFHLATLKNCGLHGGDHQ